MSNCGGVDILTSAIVMDPAYGSRFAIFYFSLISTCIRNIWKSLGGGSKFAGQCEIFNVMKRKEELTKMAASYTTPTVSVVSLEFEGCLCGSFGRTTSSDPDDFEYGGKF